MATRSGTSHEARKKLFSKGVRRGWLTLAEIQEAVPQDSLTPAERWLLFYSLRAAGVEVREREDSGRGTDAPQAEA